MIVSVCSDSVSRLGFLKQLPGDRLTELLPNACQTVLEKQSIAGVYVKFPTVNGIIIGSSYGVLPVC